ncbi:hypothetical protein HD599_001022 [Conyzicola lurida]|uniref:Fibronectin type-III domain-containing protein n=1 Tax=Conyzicola lurida TaxID=1172621 RepID=A0A841AMP7_9MICO|nr:Ig-like domain-containing protein [Conyzicola lurida]MBB5842699.1 hypothetical protein [Conyzicola lurida]
MIRRWIAGHKSLVATATSASVVAVLVATVALVSSGYTAQRLDLNDASVWVSNGAERFVGRANTEVFELNSVVAGEGAELDVVQRGSTVLLFDRGDATLDIVDAATSAITDRVPLPPSEPGVFLAGDNAVLYSGGSGEVWILPVAELADFDTGQEPTLNLGPDAVVSVDENGLLFAFSPDTQRVYSVNAALTTSVDSSEATELGGTSGDYAVTSVGGRWAVLDVDGEQLETGGRVVDLADLLDGAEPVLQNAAAAGSSVLVSFAGGLASVPLGKGDPDLLFAGGAGTTTAPAVVDGCAYAAWSNGQSWRQCGIDDAAGADEADLQQLLDVPSTAALDFQVNGSRIVLNDAGAGASWAVADQGQIIDNWDDLITVDEDQEQVEQNASDTPPEVEKDQVPPVAVDDQLGARAGRSSVLPVLLNDYDPNADVIVISAVTAIDPSLGRIDVIENRQMLQISLDEAASGVISFGYTIDDGRGGSASATVEVTVRSPEENSPPQQVRTTALTLESGGQETVPVLDDWVDPDGDPFYLESATAGEPLTVSYKPEGSVIVTDSGSDTGSSVVSLVVSDGSASAPGSLAVSVMAPGEVPIVADPFVVLAYAGQEKSISPLDHVRGGNGSVRLNAVPAKAGVTITPSYETGTFQFSSDLVRSHYLEYVVTDNDQTVTGLVRVDVVAPPDANTAPITRPKTVFVPTLSSRTVDISSTDEDPAGGVLLVTGVVNVPSDSGVRAETLEQRSVRVTLTGPLAGPVTFGYRVTNGLAQAEGTITVIEVAPPDQRQPPVARDDTATVRVGDAIMIDVMANDEQPDGEQITLNPELVDGLTGDSGLLFVSGTTLRYLAPQTAGNYSAVYEIIGPLGQTAQAQVNIEVREPNLETNHAPVPVTVTARVFAGESVRIDIPLDGIDPDGDSVQLLGQETSPEKGGVVAVGASTIDYNAGAYSAGTDTFTYTVMDSLGARATGTVRVGISPKLEGTRNPVAIEDEVTVRPGTTVLVQVLANDSDPDGGALSVTDVQPNDENLTAEIEDSTLVRITAPNSPGNYGLVYTIANEVGGSSSNFVTVVVSSDAPLSYPLARDTVLTLTDVLDRTSIDVDVLANVFFADGDARDLDLSIVSGYGDSAVVTANKSVRVTIGDSRQIIPFAVSRPDDSSAVSYAFIWVPGFDDALPQLNRDAPALVVESEATIRIDLNDYVVAVGGKQVRLTDSSTVRATHSNGSSLVVDADTLSFTSADLYFGSASISFEVTDGDSATDPDGHTANLVLPITVEPRENQPPVFTGATIDFEPGEERTIDLTALTNYPYEDDLDELAYTVGSPAPDGFTATLAGQSLVLRASDDAVKGSSTAVSLGVSDALSSGQAGRIQLQVVASTRPRAVPAEDAAIAQRGQTTVVDVLANDEATNPFPGQPLRVVAVRGLDGSTLPAGVSVTASEDNSRLTVSVAGNALPADATLQYQVADASRDPDRYVWGAIRISVQDVPDAPVMPTRQAATFTAGEMTLRLTAPQQNNSAITNYRVSSGGYSHDCGTTLICTLPGLEVGKAYSFQVVAVNAIGDSAPSPASAPYTIDYLPAAPVAKVVPTDPDDAPTGGALTVTWPFVGDPDPGTRIVDYVVELTGRASVVVPRTATSTTITGLPTNTTYEVRVYARNSAQVTTDAEWVRSGTVSATTVGPPIVGTPAPVAVNDVDGNITVTWGAFGENGGAPVTYDIRKVEGEVTVADCDAAPSLRDVTSPWVDENAVDGTAYSYVVYGDNGSYCTPVSTGATTSLAAPGFARAEVGIEVRPTTPTVLNEVTGDDLTTGRYEIRVGTNLRVASGTAERYEYRLNGGAWAPTVAGQWLTSAADTRVYGVPQVVELRGCRDASQTYCGPASDAVTLTPVNARGSVRTCIADRPLDYATPANGSGATTTVLMSYYTLANPTWSPFYFDSDDAVPLTATGVRLKVAVTVGGITYTDPGYAEGTCR